MAQEGNLEDAVGLFKEAQIQNSSLDFEPETKAKQVFAKNLVEQGQILAKNGKITKAISKHQQAQQIYSKVEISANNWNGLCWYGSLYGYVTKVMEYCEKAVELEPYVSKIRDSRALARTLHRNNQGAIEDFQFAIEKSSHDEKWKQKRQNWIDALRKGKNPFTEEMLKELR